MSNAETSAQTRVAVLRALLDEIKSELNTARAEAQEEYRAKRGDGVKTLKVSLPNGEEVGTISIKDGARTVTPDRDALLAHVKATAPTEVVEMVDPKVLADPELIAWVLQNRPDSVREEVRSAYEQKILSDLDDNGDLVNTTTGQIVHLAEVRTVAPTGEFSYRPRNDARQRVMDAWRSGELVDLGGLFAALPKGGEQQ